VRGKRKTEHAGGKNLHYREKVSDAGAGSFSEEKKKGGKRGWGNGFGDCEVVWMRKVPGNNGVLRKNGEGNGEVTASNSRRRGGKKAGPAGGQT